MVRDFMDASSGMEARTITHPATSIRKPVNFMPESSNQMVDRKRHRNTKSKVRINQAETYGVQKKVRLACR
jgi:hypothetical protein